MFMQTYSKVALVLILYNPQNVYPWELQIYLTVMEKRHFGIIGNLNGYADKHNLTNHRHFMIHNQSDLVHWV